MHACMLIISRCRVHACTTVIAHTTRADLGKGLHDAGECTQYPILHAARLYFLLAGLPIRIHAAQRCVQHQAKCIQASTPYLQDRTDRSAYKRCKAACSGHNVGRQDGKHVDLCVYGTHREDCVLDQPVCNCKLDSTKLCLIQCIQYIPARRMQPAHHYAGALRTAATGA